MNGAIDVSVSSIVMYDETRNAVLPTLPMSPCPQDGCQTCHYGELIQYT